MQTVYPVQLLPAFADEVVSSSADEGYRVDRVWGMMAPYVTSPGDVRDLHIPPSFVPSVAQTVATSTGYTVVKRGETPHIVVSLYAYSTESS